MFQAEYSSGQPLRMLVDLRASVADALAGNVVAESGSTSPAAVLAAKAAAAGAGASFNRSESASKSTQPAVAPRPTPPKIEAKTDVDDSSPREFDVSGAPEWDPDSASPPAKQE